LQKQAQKNLKGPSLWSALGPGLITGAADDDPSGVATYSQVGAQVGFAALWTMLFTWPLMSAIQMASAQIGRVTGRGLSANIRQFYGKKLALPIMLMLFVSNVFNLGADISAMGAAVRMLIGGNAHIYALLLTLASLLLQIFVPYHRYSKILKWLTFVLFAYVGVVFFVRAPIADVLRGTFIPSLHFDEYYIGILIAVLGTTISPYLFFWQSSQEVEEIRTVRNTHALKRFPEGAALSLRTLRKDTMVGMAISNLVAYFIIYSTAATLHVSGQNSIVSAEQAAGALRPLAGEFCFILFALGILGTGLLAVPVLAGSAAFAVGETMRFRSSLEEKPNNAKRFYGVLALATLAGLAIIYSGIDPIKALVWSAMLNGIISAPVMIVIMLMASREKIMGDFTIKGFWKILGWLATLVMTVAVIVFFVNL
jgi:NRAMP (natural resistance-associated macrophage protein)-like metal ion transporter